MINENYYNIYGLLVKSNIKMPLLNMITDVNKVDLDLNVEYSDVDDGGIEIKENHDFFDVKLGGYADYKIYSHQNKITCYAKDFESFFSTIFNIPFSVYFLLRKEILFHTCSLLYNDDVFCLSGSKGVGKSTLTQLLGDNVPFEMFGDDTIRISNNRAGYRPHDLIKFTEETVQRLNVKNIYDVKNATGKNYGKIQSKLSSAKINSIIQLVRTDDNIPKIKVITNPIIKHNIFVSNIVGASYFPHILLKNILNTKFEQSINFCSLYTPNNLNALIESKEHIKELLLSKRNIS